MTKQFCGTQSTYTLKEKKEKKNYKTYRVLICVNMRSSNHTIYCWLILERSARLIIQIRTREIVSALHKLNVSVRTCSSQYRHKRLMDFTNAVLSQAEFFFPPFFFFPFLFREARLFRLSLGRRANFPGFVRGNERQSPGKGSGRDDELFRLDRLCVRTHIFRRFFGITRDVRLQYQPCHD
ncbi:hypothetical protein PUN28_000664 [Cardiocondyla obscurior]|uniref:Uncharacterized protein n=1 Tax=Cardiocondyla obscurior TaxID=286306 RepID=A0AAW2H0G6_9HYME